ncbi:helix-turn-helix domain-containing protein [Candidatus Woesearchaeota archaeon]|nr:helix-turn-helix domain-containing protein [Candidatus Woesearchaeota archaeon]
MDLEYPLKEFGLNDKEAKVYLTLLPLGTVSLQEIARRANYPRTTVYNTLNYLINKGLVAKIVKKNVTHYIATDPERLMDTLEEKKRLIAASLPKLKAMRTGTATSSTVEIYEGFKGVHTILSDLCKIKQQVIYFGGYKKSLEVLKHLPNYVRIMRIQKKIKARMVYDPTDEPILHTKEYQAVSNLRFWDGLTDFPAMVFVYGDKVSMFSWKTDLVGAIITNKDFSTAMQMLFELVWEKGIPAKYPADIKLKDIAKS